MISTYSTSWMTPDVQMFRTSVRRFLQKEFAPHQDRWREQRHPDREAWRAAGHAGILLPDLPQDYGGGGGTFAHHVVVVEELARMGISFGASAHSVVAHYILAYGTEDQKRKWHPLMARGELVGAIALSEPGAGSDLQNMRTRAHRENGYRINGSKTFITNGHHAGLVCLAAKTDVKAPSLKGISLVMVETSGLAGYKVGRPIDTIGTQAQDTCELFFDDVRIPEDNLLGSAEGRGFLQILEQLPYERLTVAASAIATAEEAVRITAKYVMERTVADKPIINFQNARFKLAECKTEAHIGRVFLDNCIERFLAGSIDDVTVAMAKYWMTDCEGRIVDECVQMHGGYGYVASCPISRMWVDSRVHRIYAGTNEVMKELIGWAT